MGAFFGIIRKEYFLVILSEKLRIVVVSVGLIQITKPIVKALFGWFPC